MATFLDLENPEHMALLGQLARQTVDKSGRETPAFRPAAATVMHAAKNPDSGVQVVTVRMDSDPPGAPGVQVQNVSGLELEENMRVAVHHLPPRGAQIVGPLGGHDSACRVASLPIPGIDLIAGAPTPVLLDFETGDNLGPPLVCGFEPTPILYNELQGVGVLIPVDDGYRMSAAVTFNDPPAPTVADPFYIQIMRRDVSGTDEIILRNEFFSTADLPIVSIHTSMRTVRLFAGEIVFVVLLQGSATDPLGAGGADGDHFTIEQSCMCLTEGDLETGGGGGGEA